MANLIANLCLLTPQRPLTIAEAFNVAELQANRLLEWSGLTMPPVPNTLISSLPRIRVRIVNPLPASGMANWSKGRWMILLNGSEPLGRQRFSLAHELKHILDSAFGELLYPALRSMSAEDRGERVADFFAASLLMPKMWVKRAMRSGITDLGALAYLFDVSQAAMQVRLMSLGLADRTPRCSVVMEGATR